MTTQNTDYEWITTYTGKHFHYLNPTSDEICIMDIAHHLSLLCRFTGACKTFYSVGEHSIRVANILPPRLKLAGLLHDAAEAYMNDISRPIKCTHKLALTEKGILDVISQVFDINCDVPEVKEADNILLATEGRDLMNNTNDWEPLPPPLPEIIIPSPWYEVKKQFLDYYFTLVNLNKLKGGV